MIENQILDLNLFLNDCNEEKDIVCIKRDKQIDFIHNFEWSLDDDNLVIWNAKDKFKINNIKNIKDYDDFLTLETENGNIVLEIM